LIAKLHLIAIFVKNQTVLLKIHAPISYNLDLVPQHL